MEMNSMMGTQIPATEEFKDMIKESHEDEVVGVEEYMRMARIAKDKGMYKAYHILKDIAEDENSHANMLLEILKEA